MDLFAGDASGRSVGSTRERTRSILGAADPIDGGGGRSRSASTSTSVSVTSAVDTDRGSARMDVPSSAAVTAMAQIDLDSDPSVAAKDGASGNPSGLTAASDAIAASAGRANLWQLARLQVRGVPRIAEAVVTVLKQSRRGMPFDECTSRSWTSWAAKPATCRRLAFQARHPATRKANANPASGRRRHLACWLWR